MKSNKRSGISFGAQLSLPLNLELSPNDMERSTTTNDSPIIGQYPVPIRLTPGDSLEAALMMDIWQIVEPRAYKRFWKRFTKTKH